MNIERYATGFYKVMESLMRSALQSGKPLSFNEAVANQINQPSPHRFYVEYDQDCGYGAVMTCHGIIEAPNLTTAQAEWQTRLGSQGFAVSPAFSNEANKVIMITGDLDKLSNEEILERMKSIES
jgi:hypothetical protein